MSKFEGTVDTLEDDYALFRNLYWDYKAGSPLEQMMVWHSEKNLKFLAKAAGLYVLGFQENVLLLENHK